MDDIEIKYEYAPIASCEYNRVKTGVAKALIAAAIADPVIKTSIERKKALLYIFSNNRIFIIP